jgi:hypothetical protein
MTKQIVKSPELEIYHLVINGKSVGCWRTFERAKEAAERFVDIDWKK